jgi:hypothetical protein
MLSVVCGCGCGCCLGALTLVLSSVASCARPCVEIADDDGAEEEEEEMAMDGNDDDRELVEPGSVLQAKAAEAAGHSWDLYSSRRDQSDWQHVPRRMWQGHKSPGDDSFLSPRMPVRMERPHPPSPRHPAVAEDSDDDLERMPAAPPLVWPVPRPLSSLVPGIRSSPKPKSPAVLAALLLVPSDMSADMYGSGGGSLDSDEDKDRNEEAIQAEPGDPGLNLLDGTDCRVSPELAMWNVSLSRGRSPINTQGHAAAMGMVCEVSGAASAASAAAEVQASMSDRCLVDTVTLQSLSALSLSIPMDSV